MADDLWNAKQQICENLESLRLSLVLSVDEGMIDLGDTLYNQILALIEDCGVIANWDETVELIDRSKTLEDDIDVWLALHGRSSLSLSWPTRNS